MTTSHEQLKQMINNFINDKHDEAAANFSDFLTAKMKTIANIQQQQTTPAVEDNTFPDSLNDDNDELNTNSSEE